jgi:predicted nucleic acid-binding protein
MFQLKVAQFAVLLLKPSLPTENARKECKRYAVWHPWVIDQATVQSAWEIERRYGLQYWDFLVVAAAQQ